jgi:hypothetical protein
MLSHLITIKYTNMKMQCTILQSLTWKFLIFQIWLCKFITVQDVHVSEYFNDQGSSVNESYKYLIVKKIEWAMNWTLY